MYGDDTVAVVVPAYNEAGFVGSVLRGLPSYVDRVYAVNDASTDDTWAEMLDVATGADGSSDTALDSFDPARADRSGVDRGETTTLDGGLNDRIACYEETGKFVLLDHDRNYGAGGAIKTGYLAARSESIDVTVTIDADDQMDPRLMHRVVQPVVSGECGYAKGSRFLDAAYRREMPLVRRFGNTALTYMTKAASGYWPMTDSQNGYTAISQDALERVDVEGLFEYYAYCNAVLVRLRANGVEIADVEVPTTYGDETSDIDVPTFVRKVTPMLCSRLLWRVRTQLGSGEGHPAPSLYAFGVGSVLVAASMTLLDAATETNGGGRHVPAVTGLASLVAGVVVEWLQSSELATEVRYDADAERVGGAVADQPGATVRPRGDGSVDDVGDA